MNIQVDRDMDKIIEMGSINTVTSRQKISKCEFRTDTSVFVLEKLQNYHCHLIRYLFVGCKAEIQFVRT